MPLLGAHQSIAGGYYKAVEIGAEAGCEVVQLFSKNNSQWRAKEITAEEGARFKAALKQHGIRHPLAHNSYLINLASPDDVLWKKSIDGFIIELMRADQLGIPYVVSHPGAHTTSAEATGVRRVIQALDEIHRQTPQVSAKILLENTAGQGSCLGCDFAHLAEMLDGVQAPGRLGGVCFDTCHAFAAGYPLSSLKGLSRHHEQVRSAHRHQARQGLSSERQQEGARVAR